MDLNQTEIRRELRAAQAHNAAAVPRWREMLRRTFGDPTSTTAADKAQLLGLPDRRGFLRVGGVTIAGAALLAACGDDDTVATRVGGSTDDGNMDVILANTAISLETLAIDTYGVAAASGLVQRAVVAEAAGLFMEHHVSHRDALVGTVEAAGAAPFTGTNGAVKSAIVDPALAAAVDEEDVIRLAFDLETAAAQTYVFAAGALSTPELRSTIMTIGGVEARHAAVLSQIGRFNTATVFPDAFYPSTSPLPDGGVIDG